MKRSVRSSTILILSLALIAATRSAAAPEPAAIVPVRVEPVGIGGGGSMFWPAVSPHDPKLRFVSCDMNGIYRSEDGGKSWRMLDGRQVRASYRPSSRVFFDPKDPSRLLIYGFSGGKGRLHESRDRGRSWAPFGGEAPWENAEVTDLAWAPANPAQMLAGTAKGLFRSTNSGQKWSACSGVSGKVVGVFIEPSGADVNRHCFSATEEGIYRSFDGGSTWQEADTGLPWKGIRHFAAAANSRTRLETLYVTIPSKAVDGRFAGGVYRSTDGGKTWTSAMGPGSNTELGKKDQYGLGDIAQYNWLGAAANDPNVIYASTTGTGYWPPYHFTVYRSDDRGEHWRFVFTADPRFKDRNVDLGWITWDEGLGFGGPPYGFTVCASNPDIAIYTNAGEIYQTADGGKSWQNAYCEYAAGQGEPAKGQRWKGTGLEVTTNWGFAWDPHDPRKQYICYTDIGYAHSEDGGATWAHSVGGSPWRNTFYELVFDPDVTGRIWAAASNQHDIPHWTQQEGKSPRAGHGGILVSEGGGKSWKVSGSGLPDGPAVSVVVDPRSPKDARRLWASLYGVGVWMSEDGGKSWKDRGAGLGSAGNRNCYRLQLLPDGALYCAIGAKRTGNRYDVPGGIWRSRNGGETWECLTESLKPLGMMDYAINPRDPQVLYLCTAPTGQNAAGTGGPGGCYKSADGGKSWARLPLKPPLTIAGDSASVEYFAPILDPDDPNTVYVTTTGLGTWVSRDAGSTWAELRGIPFMATHRIAFSPQDHRQLYVTTFGGGVWKLTLPAR